MPWWVNNKTTLNAFCVDNGVPAPQIFREWNDPLDIELSGLPDVFVLKPNLMSSSQGVMVLRALGKGKFFDALKSRTLTLREIIEEQSAILEKSKFKKSYRLFVEEVVIDAKDFSRIPVDYKVYCFYDKPMLVQQINRNHRPTSTAFFDSNFEELDLASNITSNWKHYQLGDLDVPATADQMLSIASTLTKAIRTPFMRVDIYNSTRGPLVGELTPAPGGPYHGTLYKFTERFDGLLGLEWERALERIQRDSQT